MKKGRDFIDAFFIFLYCNALIRAGRGVARIQCGKQKTTKNFFHVWGETKKKIFTLREFKKDRTIFLLSLFLYLFLFSLFFPLSFLLVNFLPVLYGYYHKSALKIFKLLLSISFWAIFASCGSCRFSRYPAPGFLSYFFCITRARLEQTFRA
jgi:hypothetical protein